MFITLEIEAKGRRAIIKEGSSAQQDQGLPVVIGEAVLSCTMTSQVFPHVFGRYYSE